MSELSRWQQEDGFPAEAYFEAVAKALEDAGIALEGWNIEEPWEVNYEISPDMVAVGPLRWAVEGLYVSWRCDEGDEPKHAGDFSGLGWYWCPHTKPGAGGDFAKELGLPYLAEPEEVAVAVVGLVKGRRQ